MKLQAENIHKRYLRQTGSANYFEAVQPLSLTLEPGTLTVLTGRSGSGKTTLMSMLAGLLTPTDGRVLLDDTDLYALDDAALSRLRHEAIGVVPQGRSAIDSLTVMENVLLPGMLYGRPAEETLAAQWLEHFGILSLKDAMPAELSGGELRRVALARALTADPSVLLADEPTGDLDDENTTLVLETLRAAAHEDGRAVLMVTHEREAIPYADHLFRMDGGVLTELNRTDMI